MEIDTIDPETLWVADRDGLFEVCPFLASDIRIMKTGAGYLIAYVRSAEHLQAVKDGREPIGTIQLHLSAERCRKEADRLLRAAEQLESGERTKH